MATSDPIRTIDQDGKPGRPPTVKRAALRLMKLELDRCLRYSGLVPRMISEKAISGTCQRMAEGCLAFLEENDLHVIPGRVARELSLLVGKGATTTSTPETNDQSKDRILRSGNSASPNDGTPEDNAGVHGTGKVDGRSEDPGGDPKETGKVA